tara:strand:- start:3675 stop:4769 length:1095 start_codon:yes stop_codon:yes gene_type:complete
MPLSKKVPLVAIDIGSHSVKLAQLKKTKIGYDLEKFGLLPLQPNAIVGGMIENRDAVVEAVRSLVKAEKVTTRFAVGSVSGEKVIIKKIKLPLMNREELDKTIRKEAEQHIPYNIGNFSIDFQLLRHSADIHEAKTSEKKVNAEDNIEVLLVAVEQAMIDCRTEILIKAGLKPVLIDLDVFAMMNAVGLSQELERTKTMVLVDLGDSFTHIHLVDQGFSYYTRDFKAGGNQCTEKLESTFKIPYEGARAIKAGRLPEQLDKEEAVNIIVESFDPILGEIESTTGTFKAQTGRKPGKVLLSGGGSLISGVDELFQNNLKLPVEVFNPMKFIGYDQRKFDSLCISNIAPIATVAIGLATRRFDYQS